MLTRAEKFLNLRVPDRYVPVLLLLPSLALFRLFFQFPMLDPGNVGWLLRSGSDVGAHALGFHAYRNGPFGWPPAYSPLLSWPEGITLMYTDSNPLASMLLKPLSPLLPADFQFIGAWYLLCIFLNLVFGWLLLRRHAPNQILAILGAIAFGFLPALYDGRDHFTLCSHWTILWALWIGVEVPVERRTRHFAMLLPLTALLHPYLLFMVGAVWGVDWVAACWRRRGNGWHMATDGLRDATIVLLPTLLAILLAGFRSGAALQSFGFGWFAAGIDAWINPMHPDYSRFLPAWEATDGQWLEGFHYLGAGLLTLIAIAIALIAASPRFRAGLAPLCPAWPATLACLVLAVIAISNVLYFRGEPILSLPLPEPVIAMLGIVRASGRFLWALSYLLILGAILVVMRLRPIAAVALLLACLTLQTADLLPMAQAMRYRVRDAYDATPYAATPSPEWNRLIDAAQATLFLPDMWHSMPRYYEIAWRSIGRKVPVAPAYLARTPSVQQNAFEHEQARRLSQGRLNPAWLTVVLDPCEVPAALTGPSGTARQIDGVTVFPPIEAAAGLAPIGPAPTLSPGRWYRLGEGELDCLRPVSEWDVTETAHALSRFTKSELRLRFATPSHGYVLTLLAASDRADQTADLLLDQKRVARLRLRRAPAYYRIVVPGAVADSRMVQHVSFDIADAPYDSIPLTGTQTPDARIRLYALRVTRLGD